MVETRYLLEFKDEEMNEVFLLVLDDQYDAGDTAKFLRKLDNISNIKLLKECSLRVGSKVYTTTENKAF